MDIMVQLQESLKTIAKINETRAALGRVLTPEQQIAISRKLQRDPDDFLNWVETDVGRNAVRAFADWFLKGHS